MKSIQLSPVGEKYLGYKGPKKLLAVIPDQERCLVETAHGSYLLPKTGDFQYSGTVDMLDARRPLTVNLGLIPSISW